MRMGFTLAAAAWLLSSLAARADIYQSTADDGALTLSNLPGARREVLVAEPPAEPVAPGRGPAPAPVMGGPVAAHVMAGPAAVSPAAAGQATTLTAPASGGERPGRPPTVAGAPSRDLVAPPGVSGRDPAAPDGARLPESDSHPAAQAPVARPPSVELALHFAPGAPGAPAWSAPSAAAQPDWKGAEAGWQRARQEAAGARRPMPVDARPAASWLSREADAAGPASAAGAAAAEATEYRIPTDDIVAAVAVKHAIDPALLHAIVTVESAYNSRAVSPRGATGLMQMLPETARRYGVRDLFDPVQNLTAGALYLRDLLLLFKQDLSLALAAYNAGENAVIRHGNVIPPYPETQNYVPRVLATYRAYARFFAQRRTPL